MKLDSVPYIIMVASGKGGVGKTTVASDIARTASEFGYDVGLVDGDISTPNTPEVVGDESFDPGDQRRTTGDSIVPLDVNGVQVISQGMYLPDDVPVLRDGVWRSEVAAEFIDHVEWADTTDIVVIDTPPGTGEELQVLMSKAFPDYALVVTTPHPSSIRDAKKTYNFFDDENITHRTVLNMTHIPAEDIAEHVAAGVDLKEIQGIGASTSKAVVDLIRDTAPDFDLFGNRGLKDGDTNGDVPFDSEVVARVPYTEDPARRRDVYSNAVERIVSDQEGDE